MGANVIWLLGCMTSWGAVFFLAVHLQVTLGLRPITAGMLLTPIYLVMMAGSPVAAALARRFGRRRVVVAGLAVYAAGLLLLSTIAATTVPWGVLAPLGVSAVGMATLTAPLAAAAMSALHDEDQGIASGVNNAIGQLAGLLAIIVLPALAPLGCAVGMWTVAARDFVATGKNHASGNGGGRVDSKPLRVNEGMRRHSRPSSR